MKLGKTKHKKGTAEMEGVIVGSNRSFRPSKKMLIILVAIVLVIGLTIFVLVPRVRESTEKKQQGSACVNEEGLLAEAKQLFSYDELDELKVMADRIQTLEKFEQDPNCLYVLVRFNVLNNDALAARQNLDKYKAVYSSEDGLDEALGEKPMSTEELEQEVAAAEAFREQIKSNSQYF